MTTTMGQLVAMLTIAVGACGHPASGSDDHQAQPPEPPRFERPAMVRLHMQRHFDDLHQIERLLVAGKLDDAKSLAFLLTKPASDPGMAPWAAESADVVEAARALAAAPGIDEACRREARVAAACAECHFRTQKVPIFPVPSPAPAEGPLPAARMARHQWAVDRLWEGIVAGADHPWHEGLDVLASTPLPFTPITDAPALAAHLQELARSALAKQKEGAETLEDRARVYGEILVTCAACHSSIKQMASVR